MRVDAIALNSSPASEVLQLAARLSYGLRDSRLVMVCGVQFDQGVAALAIELGRCFAMMRSGLVGVLDCERNSLARPEFRSAMQSAGLLNAIRKSENIERVEQNGTRQSLKLLSLTGQTNLAKDEFVSSDFSAVGVALKQRYELSFLVAEPLLASSVTPLLAGMVDGVLLAPCAGQDRRDAIAAAINFLEQVKVRALGTVLIEP